MKIFVNWKELKEYPITQNESGFSHLGLKYASGVKQLALDFGNMGVGFPVTLDVDCKVTFSSKASGNYIVVQVGEFLLMFVHVNGHAQVGSIVKAGGVICRIAPSSENGGYEVHLHTSARKNGGEYPIRSIIFDSGIGVGAKVEFLAETNIRQGNGTSYPILDLAKVGAVAEVIGGARVADGYTWFDCKFLSGTGWCIDKHMKVTNKAITFPDGSVPVVDPCQVKIDAIVREYEGKLNEAKIECERQMTSLRLSAREEARLLKESAERLEKL